VYPGNEVAFPDRLNVDCCHAHERSSKIAGPVIQQGVDTVKLCKRNKKDKKKGQKKNAMKAKLLSETGIRHFCTMTMRVRVKS
jgi:hypothetical protein